VDVNTDVVFCCTSFKLKFFVQLPCVLSGISVLCTLTSEFSFLHIIVICSRNPTNEIGSSLLKLFQIKVVTFLRHAELIFRFKCVPPTFTNPVLL